MNICIVIYIFCHCAGTGYAETDIVKNTTTGGIVGRVRNVSGHVEEYLGIPYAAPPIGKLRWKAPVPLPSWSDSGKIWNATYPRSQCPQANSSGDVTGDEDCLYLNVYVPRTPTSEFYPVMIFIHPGSFQSDSGNAYDGTLLSDQRGVIIVTFNYRLGALGFLNTGDSYATGNYGLLDQKAVLEWVQDNIANFRGDPDRVTIFGAAAGAVSTLVHAISPQTQNGRKLFHRVISQSGSPFSWWGFQTDPAYYALKIVGEAGCRNFSMQSKMKCMRAMKAEDIVKSQLEVRDTEDFPFVVTVDGSYITAIPDVMVTGIDLLSNLQGRYEYLIGVNDFESAWDYPFIKDVENKEGFTKFLRVRLREHFKDCEKVADIVALNYIDPVNPPHTALEWKYLSFNASRDWMFLAPSLNMTRLVSSSGDGFNSTAYFYLFAHEPSQPLVEAGKAFPSSDIVDGATHKDEIAYVFGVPFTLEGATDLDRRISTQVMTRWTNFAKHGNPSREGDAEVTWPEFKWETQKFLQFGGDAVTENETTDVGSHLQSREVIFWTRELEFFGEGKGFDDPTPMGTGIDQAIVAIFILSGASLVLAATLPVIAMASVVLITMATTLLLIIMVSLALIMMASPMLLLQREAGNGDLPLT